MYIHDRKNVDLDVKHQHKQASKEPDRKTLKLKAKEYLTLTSFRLVCNVCEIGLF